jgi:hypothetical protein
MEITSFVLGMLTIVAAIMITAIVVGMVKISKLTKEQDSLQQLCAAIEGDLRREIENVYNNMTRETENTHRIIRDTHNDINMVEQTILNQVDETRRYIDSRIDKVVVKGTLDSSKQVIKG